MCIRDSSFTKKSNKTLSSRIANILSDSNISIPRPVTDESVKFALIMSEFNHYEQEVIIGYLCVHVWACVHEAIRYVVAWTFTRMKFVVKIIDHHFLTAGISFFSSKKVYILLRTF